MNETYEAKKQERQERKDEDRKAMLKARNVARLKSSFIFLAIILALGFGAYFLIQRAKPQGEDFSRAVPLLEASHIEVGSTLPEYSSNPPTSGPHYAQTARSGFRKDVLSDQNIIHNLEHGDVWIAFHPRVPDSIKKELEQFGAAKVIITSREANDTDIALAAWGRIDTFNIENGESIPTERIKDFIKRYSNQGPERVPRASGGI